MERKKIFIMKGVSCSGKSTIAKQLAQKEQAVILSSDDIGSSLGYKNQPNESEVFDVMEKQAKDWLAKGRNIILDTTNLTRKRTNRWMNLARQFNAKAVCVFINVDDIILDRQINKRMRSRWTHYSEEEMTKIKFHMRNHLQVPTVCDRFDDIILCQREEFQSANKDWLRFFMDNEQEILQSPRTFMTRFYQSGEMEKILPELALSYGYYQENTHHSLDVFGHMMKAAESVPVKKPEFVWALMLHDIGKIYPGVKTLIAYFPKPYLQFKKNIPFRLEYVEGKYYVHRKEVPREKFITDGKYHYHQHENLSAQMAYLMLARIGFPKEFIIHVASLIQHHMALPYGQTPHPRLVRNLHPIYEDLLIIREGDLQGK